MGARWSLWTEPRNRGLESCNDNIPAVPDDTDVSNAELSAREAWLILEQPEAMDILMLAMDGICVAAGMDAAAASFGDESRSQ